MSAKIIREIKQYAGFFESEIEMMAPLMAQIGDVILAQDKANGSPGHASSLACWPITDRRCLPGHLTASAMVVSMCSRKLLMIEHKSLMLLLQPGGHLEATDESMLAASIRECLEETGVQAQLHPWTKKHGVALDMDRHMIPASMSKKEPAHWHHDFMFLLQADEGLSTNPQLNEVNRCDWKLISELEKNASPRLARALSKLENIQCGQLNLPASAEHI